MVIHWSAAVVMLIGAAVYVLSPNAKAAEIGRLTFFVGLFWLVARLAPGGITVR